MPPQVVPVTWKSPVGFVTLVIVNGPLPVLLTVIVLGADVESLAMVPKLILPGLTAIFGVGKPVPVISTVVGELGALDAMTMLELNAGGLTAVGENLTVIWHELPGARDVPVHGFAVMLKGAAGGVTDVIDRFAVPLFDTLIFRSVVVPICLPPKSSGEGDTKMFGTTEPVPERFTGTDGVTGSFEFMVKDED